MRVLVTGAVSATFYPAFARIRDSGEPISPHYLNIVSGFTAIAWPALAALALAAEPVVLLLYGPGWGGVAPVLRWVAISELVLVGVPLHMDLPVLLGRIQTLIRVNMIDTLLSICLLALGAHWGLDYLAASRLAYALIWAAMYLTLLYSIIAFDIGALIRIYAKSACGALAALTPMALVMSQQTAPLGFIMLLICTIAGIALWLMALHLVRHPAEALIQRELRALIGVIFRTSTPDQTPL
jgi:O-antigen/teichoic acid export membrane protein